MPGAGSLGNGPEWIILQGAANGRFPPGLRGWTWSESGRALIR